MLRQPYYKYLTASVSYAVTFGTSIVIAAMVILLIISYFSMHNAQALGSLMLCVLAGIYLAGVYALLRRRYYRPAGYLLSLFYLLLGSDIEWSWGVNTPFGLLVLGLVIVLAGILLAGRYALVAGLVASLILVIIQMFFILGWHLPDTSWTSTSTFGDVLAYCLVFGMLALVSWLYSREMERALTQAMHAETALLQQKATLKKQVKERTEDLRRVQLGEMRQMYNFAKLGQLGIVLLHDFANHLTALTLEIDGMESRQNSKELARAQQIMQYLSDTVESTQNRLHGGADKQAFDMVRKINETVDFLHHKAFKRDVVIEWKPPVRSWKYSGDADSFCQVVAILTNNAVDAYSGSTNTTNCRVVVAMQFNDAHVIIRVDDWGKGISKTQRKQLFKPQHSTKKTGLGLGLYIAKQTVEMQFLGTLTLSSKNDHTEFIIKLPLNNEK